MGQTRSLFKAQHRLQVNLHMSLVDIITIGPTSSSSLGGAAPHEFFKLEILVPFPPLSLPWCSSPPCDILTAKMLVFNIMLFMALNDNATQTLLNDVYPCAHQTTRTAEVIHVFVV